MVFDALGSSAPLLPSCVTLGNSPDDLISPGIGDGGIGAPQLLPDFLGLGTHCLQTVCISLVRGALTPLEAVRAHYQHQQLIPTAAGLGRPVLGSFPPGVLLSADCSAANRG